MFPITTCGLMNNTRKTCFRVSFYEILMKFYQKIEYKNFEGVKCRIRIAVRLVVFKKLLQHLITLNKKCMSLDSELWIFQNRCLAIVYDKVGAVCQLPRSVSEKLDICLLFPYMKSKLTRSLADPKISGTSEWVAMTIATRHALG